MAEGIRAPNVPLGSSLSEFLGLETVGTTKSLKRFTRANVIGPIEAVTTSFQAGGGVIFSTKAQANASLSYDAMKMAWVVLDPVAANNGVYQKAGSSGTGSWTKLANLPYSFYRAVNEGAGTANAIQATNGYPMASTDSLIVFNVTATNTSSTVTLKLNGGDPLTIKTASGNPPASGGFIPGMVLAGYINGSEFRLLSDQASASIVPAAEAAMANAQAARDVALGAVPNVFSPTRADLKALDTTTITAAYLKEVGREGQFLWREGDYSAEVAADTDERRYLASNSVSTSVGAWVAIVIENISALNSLSFDEVANNVLIGEDVFEGRTDHGGISTGDGVTAVGTGILTGADNSSTYATFMGMFAGNTAKNLYCCEGYGIRTLYTCPDGQYVAAIGTDAAFSLGYGRSSVFFGAKCGLYKFDVRESTILGVSAAYGGGSVTESVIIGLSAGDAGTPPDKATADATARSIDKSIVIGKWAGRYLNATNNIVIGNFAVGSSDVIGGGNTIVGNTSAPTLSSGANNVVIGDQAGQGITTGGSNTHVGTGAYSTTNTTNSTSIGSNAACTNSNQVTLGDGAIAELRCAVTTITAVSDRRDKTNITDLEIGLDFIREVKPRQFNWNRRDGLKKTDTPEAGVIAQELDELQTAHGVEWMGLVSKTDPDRLEASPGKLLFPLIKAVQELAAKVDAQAAEIAALKAAISPSA